MQRGKAGIECASSTNLVLVVDTQKSQIRPSTGKGNGLWRLPKFTSTNPQPRPQISKECLKRLYVGSRLLPFPDLDACQERANSHLQINFTTSLVNLPIVRYA